MARDCSLQWLFVRSSRSWWFGGDKREREGREKRDIRRQVPYADRSAANASPFASEEDSSCQLEAGGG